MTRIANRPDEFVSQALAGSASAAAALRTITARGKAHVGDKTMVDAPEPSTHEKNGKAKMSSESLRVVVGSDAAGYEYKTALKELLESDPRVADVADVGVGGDDRDATEGRS